MWNRFSWVMEAAAIMAIALANGDGKPLDSQDFVSIVWLLVINSSICLIEKTILVMLLPPPSLWMVLLPKPR
ncbi:hypothetical protein PVK06_011228 [Gossypium arboreum]|uniref:Uncharacterized protein n=2 Tax=Gossypium arboreum TaxID=29729 RepID=A0ABR0Q948_GOSAR|nr:hypothetical protein PVK06_011228 [Gossypium arboreum]